MAAEVLTDMTPRDMFDRALDIYTSQPRLFKNEIARTQYKKGCLLQDMGNFEEGTKLIRNAEKARQTIVPPEKWEPEHGEEDYDSIVQFWTR